jgi:hypothetical protein
VILKDRAGKVIILCVCVCVCACAHVYNSVCVNLMHILQFFGIPVCMKCLVFFPSCIRALIRSELVLIFDAVLGRYQ